MKTFNADTLIIGSGLAGLLTAQGLSSDQHVIILTKGSWKTCNSYYAQGGMACVTHPQDSWINHTEDTLIAGNHHNDEAAVQALTQESGTIFKRLIDLQVPFDRNPDGDFARTREGGHHHSRIVHAGGDATGKVMMETLKANLPSHIIIDEYIQVVQLLVKDKVCHGAWARNDTDELVLYKAKNIVLATGGLGQLYRPTTNAPTVTGDGIALAYSAGARCLDLEFVQFHPTLLNQDGSGSSLISEAVRGEGAFLINQNGQRIMEQVHPLKDLAPRDIVARTVYSHQLLGEQIFLDIRVIGDFKTRFPTIALACTKAGLDLSTGHIPISPGAHFVMGGIETDAYGRTSLSNLYAVGEVACTGVHGANRLASNSLLEAAGYAMRLSEHLNHAVPFEPPSPSFFNRHFSEGVCPYFESFEFDFDAFWPTKQEIQDKVTEHLGILREPSRLIAMKKWLTPFKEKSETLDPKSLTKEQSERFNMVIVAWLMTLSMIERTESRGAHFRIDFPSEKTDWLKKKLTRERVTIEHV